MITSSPSCIALWPIPRTSTGTSNTCGNAYPEIDCLSIYARVGGVYWTIYSSDLSHVGREAEPHDVEPLRTNRLRTHEVVEEGRRVLEVNFPLHQAGRAVAAVGVYTSLAFMSAVRLLGITAGLLTWAR